MRQKLFILTVVMALPILSLGQSPTKFKVGDTYGFKSSDGKILVEAVYDDVGWSFMDGYINVQKNEKWGMINEDGKLVVDIVYDQIGHYLEDGIIKVKSDKFWGFVDTIGAIVIPFEYDDFAHFGWSEGLIGARKNGKWGFIDKSNNTIIPFMYYEVGEFSEGLALAATSYSNWGYINLQNIAVIPFEYNQPYNSSFENGIAQVRLKDQSGYVNTKGGIVIPIKYGWLNRFYNGYAYAQISNGEGLFSENHKWLLYGYVDTNGIEYFEPYTDFRACDWKVTPAPEALPDHTDTLRYSLELMSTLSGFEEIIRFGIDEYGHEFIDTVEDENIPFDNTGRWTMHGLLNLSLNQFRFAPTDYPDLSRLTRVCINVGLMLGHSEYPKTSWDFFKRETIYRIISSESLRILAINWITPYYKKAFQTLHHFHQNTYKDIAQHLKDYINAYDIDQMRRYLRTNEADFAYLDSDGGYNPYRKLFAFLDRLILVHKVISVEDAKTWINKIADDVLTW